MKKIIISLDHVMGAIVAAYEREMKIRSNGCSTEDGRMTLRFLVDKARTREYGGSGVGLSIVKASMEQLGQPYGVYNCEDGVSFWFELDCQDAAEMIQEQA